MAFIVSGNLGTPKTIGVTLKSSPGLMETPHHTLAHMFSVFVSDWLEGLDFILKI